MRTYVITTGIIFLLLAIAHMWRIVAERSSLASDPFFMAITLAALGMSIWAAVVIRRDRAVG